MSVYGNGRTANTGGAYRSTCVVAGEGREAAAVQGFLYVVLSGRGLVPSGLEQLVLSKNTHMCETITSVVQRRQRPTCWSLFRARQAQETENCRTKTTNRMIMYWPEFRKRQRPRIQSVGAVGRWKDTKKSRTWWCCRAPHSPTKATRKRKMPTQMTTATTLMLDTRPSHFPPAATPMSSRLTS